MSHDNNPRMRDSHTATASNHERIDVHALALTKLGRVLGPIRARMLLDAFLARHGSERLASADDLEAFGRDLATYGGSEETLGAVLCREAALHGETRGGE